MGQSLLTNTCNWGEVYCIVQCEDEICKDLCNLIGINPAFVPYKWICVFVRPVSFEVF